MTVAAPPLKPIGRRAVAGSVAGFASFGSTLLQNLVQVPFLLKYWGAEKYGAWLALFSLVTFLTVLDGGHQSFVGNLLAQYYATDERRFRSTLGSAVRFALVTGACGVALSILIAILPTMGVVAGVNLQQFPEARLALAILAIGWIATGSVSSILVRLFPPAGYFTRSTVWGIVMRVGQFLAVVLPAGMHRGLVAVAGFYALTTTVITLATAWDLRRLLPEYFPWWRAGSFAEGWRNFRSSIVLSGTAIFDGLVQQGMVLLIGSFLGTGKIPLFTTFRTIANTAVQVSSILLNPVIADMIRFRVLKEWGKVSAVFSFHWFTSTVLINGGIVVFALFAEPLYSLWTHGKLGFDPGLLSLLLVMVSLRVFAAPMVTFLQGMNRLKALSAMAITRGVLAMGIAVVGLKPLGLVACGWALLVAELIGGALLPALCVAFEYAENSQNMPKRSVRLGMVGVVCVAVAQARLFSHGPAPTLMVLGAAAVILAYSWLQLDVLPSSVLRQLPFASVWQRRLVAPRTC